METSTGTTTKTRRFFAGANTKHGFYNLFNQINQTSRSGLLYILKGGPGMGKSTLMKKIGSFFEGKTDVEYFYCSSDVESLDGVRLPAVNIAVVDGTAPHVTETVIPGAREKIIDLGAFIGCSIKQNEKEIAELIGQKQLFFKEAYLYINNASNLFDCNNLVFSSLYAEDDAEIKAKKEAGKILRRYGLCGNKKTTNGKSNQQKQVANKGEIRKLFLSAIGGDDFIDFAPYNNYESIEELNYDIFLSGLVLKQLAELLKKRGLDTVCFLQPLSPDNLSGVFIPSAEVLITVRAESNAAIKNKAQADMVFYNNAAIKDAVFAAGRALSHAKITHKKIEEFYIPAMDFVAISEVTKKLIHEIENSF